MKDEIPPGEQGRITVVDPGEEEEEEDEMSGAHSPINDEVMTFFQWVERLSYRFLGNDLTQFVIRRRFVLSRVLIVFVYWTVGIEYYHGEEHWDRIDCAYFITVTTTTVGYGDFHPSTQATQLFTVFYAIFGIAFVLSSVTDLVNYLMVRKMQTRVLTLLGVTNMESRAWFKLIFSFCCVLSMITIGTVFFNINEGWPPATALYWTIITMLTIGYGDLTIGDSSRKFSIWFIWTCVVIYIMAISNIFDTVEELKNAALRKEILRAHRVDILDLLENDRRDRETVTDGRIKNAIGPNSLAAIYPVTPSSSSRPGASDEIMYEDSPIETDRRGRSGDIELGKTATTATMSPLIDAAAGRPSNTSLASSLFKTVDDDVAVSQKSRGSFAPPARNSSLLGPEHGFTDPYRRGSDDDSVSTRRLNPAGGAATKKRASIFDDPGALQAKSDRFVIEMLVKMKKVDQLKDIDPLVKHFEEIGQMREEHKDASKEVCVFDCSL